MDEALGIFTEQKRGNQNAKIRLVTWPGQGMFYLLFTLALDELSVDTTCTHYAYPSVGREVAVLHSWLLAYLLSTFISLYYQSDKKSIK